jgi:acyl-CoA synthetase (AMP-forming)/AMP-acid ligase II
MNCLLDLLEHLDSNFNVLFSSSRILTASHLAATVRRTRDGDFAPLAGQSVSVHCHDPAAYIEALAILDGWARQILLLGATSDEGCLASFEKKVDVAWRVVARKERFDVEPVGPTSRGVVSTSWVIPTSGTTGVPKLISHTFQSLTRTLKKPTPTSHNLRWGLLYDLTRYAGLQVVLQAIGGGSSLIVSNDFLDLESSIALLAQHGCNALSATPSQWRKIAISGKLSTLDLRIVTLGGEAPDQKILNVLRQTFPRATIRHIYASTEVGVGFSVADCKVGFPVSFLQEPPFGIELKVREDGMLLLRPSGEANQTVMGNDNLFDVEGWIESGDLVKAMGDRYVFLGRANSAINVGGRKVHPTSIEQVLGEVDGVRAARVFGKPNSVLGFLVAAEIIAEPGFDVAMLRECLIEHCKRRLDRFQTPALYAFVDDFALMPTGKIKR